MTINELKDYLDDNTIWNYIITPDPGEIVVKSFNIVEGELAPFDYMRGNEFSFPDGLVPSQEPDIIGNFQYTGYRCPRCNRRLYKTIFPEGQDPRLYTHVKSRAHYIEPARVFACPDCLEFYATEKGRHLIDMPFKILHAGFGFDEFGINLFKNWWTFFDNIGDLYARRNE